MPCTDVRRLLPCLACGFTLALSLTACGSSERDAQARLQAEQRQQAAEAQARRTAAAREALIRQEEQRQAELDRFYAGEEGSQQAAPAPSPDALPELVPMVPATAPSPTGTDTVTFRVNPAAGAHH